MKVQSVSEINQQIKGLIENRFLEPVSIRGELSNFSASPSGHLYFVLKDEKSKIKAVMFKGYKFALSGYSPKNGDKVIVTGDVRTYEIEGTYQIIVKKMVYDSIGDFYKNFEKVKKKLESEGLFENKKELKKIISKVALITSPKGAAIKDFLITLKNNGISIDIDLYPVPVQGESAIPEIIKAIVKAGEEYNKYDALILMRGGGSMEDLSVFNDEYIARALSSSTIPTISAIGHERDFSICDFVADVRVATPTAAAEFISEKIINFLNKIDKYETLFINKMEIKILKYMQFLDSIVSTIYSNSPENKYRLYKEKLDNLIKSLNTSTLLKLNFFERKLAIQINIIKSGSPENKLKLINQTILNCNEKILKFMSDKIKSIKVDYNENLLRINKIDIKERYLSLKNLYINVESNLNNQVKFWIEKNRNTVNLLTVRIENSNYLEKGYALVRNKNKRVVSSVDDINLEDSLEICLKDGYIDCFVDGKRKNK